MKTSTGLWIDHRKAIIVSLEGESEKIRMITSDVEKQLRRTGDSPLKGTYEAMKVPASDSRQKSFTEHLKIYYDKVIRYIYDAESILIFGPGRAKIELKARLEKSNLGKHIIGIETVDKMTDRQIAAKVRYSFENSPGRST